MLEKNENIDLVDFYCNDLINVYFVKAFYLLVIGGKRYGLSRCFWRIELKPEWITRVLILFSIVGRIVLSAMSVYFVCTVSVVLKNVTCICWTQYKQEEMTWAANYVLVKGVCFGYIV